VVIHNLILIKIKSLKLCTKNLSVVTRGGKMITFSPKGDFQNHFQNVRGKMELEEPD
jgi:hypothetical protein